MHIQQMTRDSEKNKKYTKIIRKRVILFFSILVFLFLLSVYQIYVVVTLIVPKQSTSPFQGDFIFNPYQDYEWKESNEKIAIHLHSNDPWYTPERHSVNEIRQVYTANGYSMIGITDYGDMRSDDKSSDLIHGYEMGRNLRKRHALGIGGRAIVPDYFPFYARRLNVSWTFNEMQKQGSYVIVSHPSLNRSFSAEDLLEIDHYNAIEVFSPFGDNAKILTQLLDQGRNVHCMAGDDLHYFAEATIQKFDQPIWKDLLQTILLQRGRKSENLKRYIVTSKGRASEAMVLEDLKRGSFFCIKKYFADPESPSLPNIRIDSKNLVTLESNERYMEIRWIGKNGDFKQIDPSVSKAAYQFTKEDTYIRLEIVSLSGIILSNAIYRQNQPKKY